MTAAARHGGSAGRRRWRCWRPWSRSGPGARKEGRLAGGGGGRRGTGRPDQAERRRGRGLRPARGGDRRWVGGGRWRPVSRRSSRRADGGRGLLGSRDVAGREGEPRRRPEQRRQPNGGPAPGVSALFESDVGPGAAGLLAALAPWAGARPSRVGWAPPTAEPTPVGGAHPPKIGWATAASLRLRVLDGAEVRLGAELFPALQPLRGRLRRPVPRNPAAVSAWSWFAGVYLVALRGGPGVREPAGVLGPGRPLRRLVPRSPAGSATSWTTTPRGPCSSRPTPASTSSCPTAAPCLRSWSRPSCTAGGWSISRGSPAPSPTAGSATASRIPPRTRPKTSPRRSAISPSPSTATTPAPAAPTFVGASFDRFRPFFRVGAFTVHESPQGVHRRRQAPPPRAI